MAAKRAKHRARTLRVNAKPGMVELTASKRTFIECTCACSSKGPNGCKDIRVCPPSPRQTGRSCSFKSRLGASAKSLTTINGTSQSMSTGRNDRPPTRNGNHPFMGGSIPSLPRTRTAAICKNAILGFAGSLDAIRAAPPKPCAGRAGNFRTARNDQSPRTQPAGGSDRLRPPRTPSSGRLPSPP